MVKENYILSCDWGTSSLRLRLVDLRDNSILTEKISPEGIAKTFEDWKKDADIPRENFFRRHLKKIIDTICLEQGIDLTGVPLVISGMASSSIGMCELPYAELPFALNGENSLVRNFKATNEFPYPSMLISGVRSEQNVMRGEETQLVGMAETVTIPEEYSEGIFIFPGTHSKHVYISKGEMRNFETFMTGELFEVMSRHSILKDSVDTNALSEINLSNKVAFKAGVHASADAGIMKTLFTVRTNLLFNKYGKKQNAHYLSGLLIGAELVALSGKKDAAIILCSGSNLFSFYTLGIEALNLARRTIPVPANVIDRSSVIGQLKILRHNKPFLEANTPA
jgi:2-dehydro-3-deoxygalactonokinase